jgi:ABC-type nitrate/sulfonate/bicarbonate transport system substrate-binding protein
MAEPRPLRLALMWTLQGQFAPYAVARADGLPELELLERRTERSPIDELLEGRAELGVVAPGHLLAAGSRARELALVAVFMSRSPVRMAGLRERVGDRLVPRAGLRVGVWGGEDSELRAMLRIAGADLSQIEFEPVGDEAAALVSGEFDYVQCTTYNELPAIHAAAGGAERVVSHSPVDAGVDMAKDGIAVRREFLRTDPASVERFLRASIAAWRVTLTQPEVAAQALCELVPPADPAREGAMIRALAELVDPDRPLGEPRQAEIERALHTARAAGLDRDARDVVLERGPWERASA